jgi:iron complex outermembrane receptor protein
MEELKELINGQAVEIEHPIWGAKIITDLSVGFKITETAKVVIGANNIFDIYPDANLGPQTAIRPRLVSGAIDYTPSTIDLSNANQFAYSRTPLNLDKTEDSFLLV